MNLTAANHLTDTKTRLYYFDRAFLAVPPNTAGFKVSARIGGPTVHVAAKKADHTLLRIDFGQAARIRARRGASALTFDIKDPGGAPTRTTRIGTSLVAFGAWAYASDGDARQHASRSSSRRATRSTPDRTCSASRRPTATAGRSTRPARSPSR